MNEPDGTTIISGQLRHSLNVCPAFNAVRDAFEFRACAYGNAAAFQLQSRRLYLDQPCDAYHETMRRFAFLGACVDLCRCFDQMMDNLDANGRALRVLDEHRRVSGGLILQYRDRCEAILREQRCISAGFLEYGSL